MVAQGWQGWWGAPRSPRVRSRISDCRHTGSVLQWTRNFGWIAPDVGIDHPEAHKHNSKVYVNLKDVDSGKPLSEGTRVSFFAYCDGDGLGAEEVHLEDGACDEDGAAAKLLPEPEPEVEDDSKDGERPRKRLCGGEGVLADKVNGTPESDKKPEVDGKVGAVNGTGKIKGKGKCKGRGPFGGGGPDRNKTTRSGKAAVLNWASSEMRGWRPAMEDAEVAILGLDAPLERHAMFAIFDGHGGSAVSRRVSQDLPAQVTAAAAAAEVDGEGEAAAGGDGEDGGLAGRALKAALPAMDVILREAGDGQPGFLPSQGPGGPIPSDVRNAYALTGSTAIVCLLECSDSPEVGQPTRVVVANIGDSRAILCRGGAAIPLSEDHKPDDPEEIERIEKAGGFVGAVGPCMRIDGWGLNLSRAFGDFHYKARDDLPVADQKVSVIPDIRCMDITDDDEFLLLGCDGIFELHSCQEAVDHVRQKLRAEASLEEAMESLCDASCSADLTQTQGRGSDNVSAMIILLQ
mmetsp:Transcript_101419/g.326893  ORF Transcript_101419/g.326893 Transcript_101419/m.326893 type:complete len:517 (-) Transcript_101419:89-1639(-)